MSESDGEQAARSVALEQAYVHEVYEQCAEKTAQSRHWPRIYKFLEELEPGALVCDIGCGNGKYLSVNDNVFKVGADRCKRLTDIAREKENEVLICDNLALPFRDESFDAVLSIAVVHHFATTERRVNALKELARVLRIGGRLVISVWAMEQRHRKFESQDVLVPWPKAYCLNTGSGSGYPGGKLSAGAIPCINELDPDRFAQKSPLTSKRAASRKCKKRSYWIDPIFSPSPSTSSLSSPNETCYSFFRRALQKLAGGKRDSGNRAWFLETWQNGGCKNRRNFEIDDIGDVDDIPIELRRLEDDNVTVTKLPDGHSIKSKSLGDILEIQRLDLVRSRSSIPGFSSSLTSEFYLDEESKAPSPLASEGPNSAYRVPSSVEPVRNADDPELLPSWASSSPSQPAVSSAAVASASPVLSSSIQSLSGSSSSNSKPRLVKQKSHLPDDASLEFPDKSKNTAIQEFIEGTVEFQSARPKRGNVHKQSSMNEELMSMERLVERDRVRRNIMKQASLNEEIICKPSRTFGNFRDTLYSGNATKRFQLIKSGLTNRIKQSTTSMEKVSSMALKNGFVKILQGWKSGESNVDAADSDGDESKRCKELSSQRKTSTTTVQANGVTGTTICPASSAGGGKPEGETIERRLSKEDGSDSSKDSSLQSDTSVDSEDSFASVIYVPKQQQQQQHHNYQHHQNAHQLHYDHQFPSLIDVATVPVGGYQLRTTSAPPSPRIKHPPEIYGPRLKLISISPLLKQFPATSKSLPPPSPPGLSPRTFNLFGPPSNVPSVNLKENTTIVTSTQHDPIKIDATDKINIDMNMNENLGEENRSDVTKLFDADCISGESTKNDMALSQSEMDETIEAPTSDLHDTGIDMATSRKCSLVVKKVTEQENKNISANMEIVDGPMCTMQNNAVTLHPIQGANNEADLSVKSTAPSVDFCIATGSDIGDNQSEKSKSESSESISEEDSRGSRLKQIKELLKQKPGFATRCGKSSFPLVRRASTVTSGRSEMVDARTLPRLLSLELFNPETDDLDSDSSGFSSPESVGSVISVISDERFTLKNKDKNGGPEVRTVYGGGSTRCEQTSNYYEQIDDSQSLRLLDAATGASSTNSLQAALVTSAISGENDDSTRDQVDSISVDGQDNSRRKGVDGKLGENVINDIEKCYRSERISQVPIDSARDRRDTTRATSTHRRLSETSLIERYDARSTSPCVTENAIDLSSRINNCKYSQLMDDTIAWLRSATGPDNDYHYSEYTDNNSRCTANGKGSMERGESAESKSSLCKSTSEEMMDFVMVTKNGECIGGTDIGAGSEGEEETRSTLDACRPSKGSIDYSNTAEIAGGTDSSNIGSPSAVNGKTVRHGDSHESTEIEGSISLSSDATSLTGSLNTSRFCGGSTTCLVSSNLEYKTLRERRKHLYQNRSASEEIPASGASPPTIARLMDGHCDGAETVVGRGSRKSERYANSLKSVNMSGSSSQESLLSDYGGDGFGGSGTGGGGGGAITYHQYYHVFREGELDQLINKYVENLHIISSYYDHASWCIVAEKVQVWTI